MRLVDFDQEKLLPQERFYANGFDLLPVDHGSSKLMVDVLEKLWNDDVRAGFFYEKRMENVFHLRPNVYDYDDIFLDFLFANELPYLLEDIVGRKLSLVHAQVVKQMPGPPHQDWHRDAYQFDRNPIVGAFPPVVKINFYPTFEIPEPRLKFVRGTHRCMANDERFDAMLISKYENEVLESSNDRVLMFESSMLHGVVADKNPCGSVRVMYSFASEHEYQKRFADKQGHATLHDRYVMRREKDR